MKIGPRIPTMKFGSVSKLEVVYSVAGSPADTPPEIRQEKCRLSDQLVFYVHKDMIYQLSSSCAEVNKELTRFFGQGNNRCLEDIRLAQQLQVKQGFILDEHTGISPIIS